MKSTGIDFFTFYATTGAVKCNHQLVVATTGAFTLTSVIVEPTSTTLHTKTEGNWAFGSGEEAIKSVWPIADLAAIYVMWPRPHSNFYIAPSTAFADPESFIRGGPTFLRGGKIQIPLSADQHWWADVSPRLIADFVAFVIFSEDPDQYC